MEDQIKKYGCTEAELDELAEANIHVMMENDMGSMVSEVIAEAQEYMKAGNNDMAEKMMNRVDYYVSIMNYRLQELEDV